MYKVFNKNISNKIYSNGIWLVISNIVPVANRFNIFSFL